MIDSHVPYYGGQPTAENAKGAYSYLSVNESVLFWAEHDNCSSTPQTETSASENIIVDTYTGGDNDTEVILYSIVDGGHAWPGGEKGSEAADEPTDEISATDLIWEFFVNHPKK